MRGISGRSGSSRGYRAAPRPQAATASAPAVWAWASSAMSAARTSVQPLRPVISPASSARRAARATAAPWAGSARAVATQMPLVAPVTSVAARSICSAVGLRPSPDGAALHAVVAFPHVPHPNATSVRPIWPARPVARAGLGAPGARRAAVPSKSSIAGESYRRATADDTHLASFRATHRACVPTGVARKPKSLRKRNGTKRRALNRDQQRCFSPELASLRAHREGPGGGWDHPDETAFHAPAPRPRAPAEVSAGSARACMRCVIAVAWLEPATPAGP